jgi:hypothetical protein
MDGENSGVWIVTEVEVSETTAAIGGDRSGEDVGGSFGAGVVQQVRKSLTQRVQISADDLKRQIGNLLTVVGDVFDQARSEAGLLLDEVELSIEINSEGHVSIFGSGGKLGGSGGIRLIFKRKPAAS